MLKTAVIITASPSFGVWAVKVWGLRRTPFLQNSWCATLTWKFTKSQDSVRQKVACWASDTRTYLAGCAKSARPWPPLFPGWGEVTSPRRRADLLTACYKMKEIYCSRFWRLEVPDQDASGLGEDPCLGYRLLQALPHGCGSHWCGHVLSRLPPKRNSLYFILAPLSILLLRLQYVTIRLAACTRWVC